MSILIFSSDQSFGDFLSQSVRESGLQAHLAISFSDAELKLYKSEPDIAIFVDLENSELRKIGRAVSESCSVLVIGDTNQRSIIKAHWRFLTTQSSVNVVLAEISDFVLDLNKVPFSLNYEQSSCSLEEHFSTAASEEPLDSNVFGRSITRMKLATFGLRADEREQLKSEYDIVGGQEIPFCDAILLRPDTSQQCLDFLALSQSVLSTALVSLGNSNFYAFLACSIIELDSTAQSHEINDAINATKRENGPCYPSEFDQKHRTELNRLGCRVGAKNDFDSLAKDSGSLVEQIILDTNLKTPQNGFHLYSSESEFEKRRELWRMAARTRRLQNRYVPNLPDLMRGLALGEDSYLVSISTERTDSRRFVSNMLRQSVPLIVNSKTGLLCLCKESDLDHLNNELTSLQAWTGRDTQGLGWFARVQTQAFKVDANTIASVLASLGEIPPAESRFEVIDDIREKMKQ